MINTIHRIYRKTILTIKYLKTEPLSSPDLWPQGGYILITGLFYGIILAFIYAISWKCFGDIYFTEKSRLRLLPSAAVILISTMLNNKQLYGLAKILQKLLKQKPTEDIKDPTARQESYEFQLFFLATAAALIILLKYSVMLSLPHQIPSWPSDWRRSFMFLYPRLALRVVILMELWHKAGLIIAAATGYLNSKASPVEKRLKSNLSIKKLLLILLGTTIFTSIYITNWQERAVGFIISIITFLTVYAYSMLICWRFKGHTRLSIFSAAEVSSITMLLSTLAFAKYL